MKSTGIVRNIDELGRIVIPKELRKKMAIANGDPVEIYVVEDKIILTKYEPNCFFCSSSVNTCEFGGKQICEACVAKIKQL